MKLTLTQSITKLFCLALLGFSISCDSDTNNDVIMLDRSEIEAAVKSGQWHVSYYFDDKDETGDYSGYAFTFNANGTLTASNGSVSVSGAWSITDSDSSDDSSDSDVDFNIFFTSPELFEELADDWDIKKFANNKIELFDVSGGDGTTDYLTFEKN